MTKTDHFTTLAELRALTEQWHRPRELACLSKRAHDRNLINTSKLGEPGRIGKSILEEVVPLYSLGLALEDGADGCVAPVEVRAFFGDQPDDAEIRFGQSDHARLLKVKVTGAMIDGRQDALSMEHLRVHGHATLYPFVQYERDKRKKTVVPKDLEPPAQGRSSLERHIVDAAHRAAQRKANRQSSTDEALLVWLGEFNPDGLEPEARAEISRRLGCFTTRFSRIYVMGFATLPIVLRAEEAC